MAVNSSLKVLVDFAVERIPDLAQEDQIKMYQALSDILSEPAADAARNIAEALSKVAALQLDFQEIFWAARDGSPKKSAS
jgi:hypothetical protein